MSRYLSEFRHVQRGATWKTAKLMCNGRQASLEEVPFCYEGKTWEGVELDDFLSCKYNLASNRQTRMLANLSKINCYNKTGQSDEERDLRMLQSAKDNLQNFSFFGLTEFQGETQFMFENTFNLRFISDFLQVNTTKRNTHLDLSDEIMKKIKETNHLDMKLYEFANDLFNLRLKQMKEELKKESDSQEELDSSHSPNKDGAKEQSKGDITDKDTDVHIDNDHNKSHVQNMSRLDVEEYETQ